MPVGATTDKRLRIVGTTIGPLKRYAHKLQLNGMDDCAPRLRGYRKKPVKVNPFLQGTDEATSPDLSP